MTEASKKFAFLLIGIVGVLLSWTLRRAAAEAPGPATRPWAPERTGVHVDRRTSAEAVAAIDEAIRLDPDSTELRRKRLDLVLQDGKYDDVLDYSDVLLTNGVDTWWLHHQRALAYAKRKTPDPGKALAEFDKAIASVDAANDAGPAEFVLRAMAWTVGPGPSLERVKPRLAADPDNRWHLLDVSFRRQHGDFAGAAKAVERLLADPANEPTDRRVPVLKAAADAYTHGPKPEWAKAEAAYLELVQAAPDDIPALNNLTWLLVHPDAGPPRPKLAKGFSRRAYDLSRRAGVNGLVDDTHGWVLTLCGGDDAAEGLQILKFLVIREPDLPDAHYHLGEAYLRQPVPDPAAERELRTAADLLGQDDEETADPALRENVKRALGRVRKDLKPKPAN